MSRLDYDKIQLHTHACTWQYGAHNLDMNKPILIELRSFIIYSVVKFESEDGIAACSTIEIP